MTTAQKQAKTHAIIEKCYTILYKATNTAELFKLPTVKAWGDLSRPNDDDTRLEMAKAMLAELKTNAAA